MAEKTFTLTQQEYEALIALARAGVVGDTAKILQLDAFLKSIEKNNGVTRDGVWVQWQEMDQPLPPTTNFPDVWPPEMRFYVELVTRRVARADVDAVIQSKATNPLNILCTRDPAARVGWTPVDDFFQ